MQGFFIRIEENMNEIVCTWLPSAVFFVRDFFILERIFELRTSYFCGRPKWVSVQYCQIFDGVKLVFILNLTGRTKYSVHISTIY